MAWQQRAVLVGFCAFDRQDLLLTPMLPIKVQTLGFPKKLSQLSSRYAAPDAAMYGSWLPETFQRGGFVNLASLLFLSFAINIWPDEDLWRVLYVMVIGQIKAHRKLWYILNQKSCRLRRNEPLRCACQPWAGCGVPALFIYPFTHVPPLKISIHDATDSPVLADFSCYFNEISNCWNWNAVKHIPVSFCQYLTPSHHFSLIVLKLYWPFIIF